MKYITPETIMFLAFCAIILLGIKDKDTAIVVLALNYWLSIIAENTRKR